MTTKIEKKALTLAIIERLAIGEKTGIDALTPGLYVERNGDGTRSWRFRRKASGSMLKRTLGTTRDFNLVEARAWATEINRSIAEGFDPVEAKIEEERNIAAEEEAARLQVEADLLQAEADRIEAERVATTFRIVFHEYMKAITPRLAHKTIEMKWCRFNKDVLPVIGDMPISDVTLDHLDDIALAKFDAGFDVASNALVVDLKTFFVWCISRGRKIAKIGEVSPAANLKTHGEIRTRSRFLDAWELPLFLKAIADLPDVKRRMLTLMLLTGQRLDNVASATFPQWEPTVDAWVIMKMKGKKGKVVPNVLPLAPWGRSLFVRPSTATKDWLFPSGREAEEGQEKGYRSGQIRALFNTIEAKMQEHAPNGREIEHLTAHDLRRTLKSHLARLHVQKEIRHAVAGHRESGIDKHYMMYEFMTEKAEALKIWEDELTRIAVEAGVAHKLGIPNITGLRLVA